MIPTKDEMIAAANAAADKYNVKHKVAYRSGWLDAVEYLQQKLQQTHVRRSAVAQQGSGVDICCMYCESQRLSFVRFLPDGQLWKCKDCGKTSHY